MRQLPKAKTKEDVNLLFEHLEIIGEENIKGKEFILFYCKFTLLIIYLKIDWIAEYQTPWILASLNHNYSLMDHDMWMITPFDTNVSECSHANINRGGTCLKLKTVIYR